MFFIGACFSVYHGISHMLHPSELEDLWVGLAMLSTKGFSCWFLCLILLTHSIGGVSPSDLSYISILWPN